MHEIIDFLKSAVTTGDGAGVLGCYMFKSGSIYAQNMVMQAGVTLESALEFNVPAREFNAALSRMQTVQSLTYSGDEVTLKSGRVKSSIRCVADEAPPISAFPETWLPFPAAAIPAIKIARQFIGTQNWQVAIRLMDEKVTAFSSKSGIEISVPGLKLGSTMITDECAQFLVAQGAPDEYSANENSIMFRWLNGRWVRMNLVIGTMPPVEPIFDAAGIETPIAFSDEWRSGFSDAASLSDDALILGKSGFIGNRGAAISTVELSTEGLEIESRWPAAVLGPVVACATHWNPNNYPKPCPFIGPNLRGVVLGLQK